MEKVIALDCDGVLLNYIDTYQKIYEEMFNTKISVVNPRSFTADTHLGINWKGRDKEQAAFYDLFAEKGWKSMIALPGAVEATHHMKDLGYKVVIVTSMPEDKAMDRASNLQNVGVYFNDVIACGSHSKAVAGVNLKEPHLKKLKPEYFADDLLSNFYNVSDITKCILIDWSCENNDEWNTDQVHQQVKVFDNHEYLLDFSIKHLNQPIKEKAKPFRMKFGHRISSPNK